MKALLNPFRSSSSKTSQSSTPSDQPPVSENRSPNNIAVVELFQSQGCNSCPPSNRNVIKMVSSDPSLLLLTYEVTYWDHLGWQDTFGQSAFDRRQWEYAHKLGKRSVYTPQVIVNGAAEGVGNQKKMLEGLVKEGVREGPNGDIQIALRGSVVVIGSESPGAHGTVELVRYDPRSQNVDIRRGENSGTCLPHVNVVTDVSVLGSWSGNTASFDVGGLVGEGEQAGLESVILVKDGVGGRVIGAGKV